MKPLFMVDELHGENILLSSNRCCGFTARTIPLIGVALPQLMGVPVGEGHNVAGIKPLDPASVDVELMELKLPLRFRNH